MKARRADRVELQDGRQGQIVDIKQDEYEILLHVGGMVTVKESDIKYRLVSSSRVCPMCGAEKEPYDEACQNCLIKAIQIEIDERKRGHAL